jgi:hypothetical protein
MADQTWPVDLELVATIHDPETGQPLHTIRVDNTKAAPMQAINLALDNLGYSSLFYDSRFGLWRVSEKGVRRV